MRFKINSDSGDQVLTAIRHYCFIKDCSQADLIYKINKKLEDNTQRVTASKIKDRRKFPKLFIKELENLINADDFSEFDRSLIDIKVNYSDKSIYEGVNIVSAGMSFNSMNSWMKNRSEPSSKFRKICSGKNNQFLLFRAQSEKFVSISRMKIVHLPQIHTTPLFITKRGLGGFDQRIVRGQIFEAGSSIFAIGQIKGSHAIRFTRLSFVEHPIRCDLYGIRCGHSALNNRAYAHLVYAYQCNKFEPDLRAIIRSGVSIDDPVLGKHIPNWDAIAARLIPSGLSEMGLQPHP